MKLCKKCGVIKSIEDFYIRKKDGKIISPCKTCSAKQSLKWWESISDEAYTLILKKNNINREKRRKNPVTAAIDKQNFRKSHLKLKYGLTLADFDNLLKLQDYKCAICKSPEPKGKSNQWHVDHDHKTGRVRGLLCNNCNPMLGQINDNKQILFNAIKYLEKYDE